MTIDERKAQLKQNIETGAIQAYGREIGLTDKEIEDILHVCKRALDGVYGDEIFSPEHNLYIRQWEKLKNDNKM